jgi:hypothetical protein
VAASANRAASAVSAASFARLVPGSSESAEEIVAAANAEMTAAFVPETMYRQAGI